MGTHLLCSEELRWQGSSLCLAHAAGPSGQLSCWGLPIRLQVAGGPASLGRCVWAEHPLPPGASPTRPQEALSFWGLSFPRLPLPLLCCSSALRGDGFPPQPPSLLCSGACPSGGPLTSPQGAPTHLPCSQHPGLLPAPSLALSPPTPHASDPTPHLLASAGPVHAPVGRWSSGQCGDATAGAGQASGRGGASEQ